MADSHVNASYGPIQILLRQTGLGQTCSEQGLGFNCGDPGLGSGNIPV